MKKLDIISTIVFILIVSIVSFWFGYKNDIKNKTENGIMFVGITWGVIMLIMLLTFVMIDMPPYAILLLGNQIVDMFVKPVSSLISHY